MKQHLHSLGCTCVECCHERQVSAHDDMAAAAQLDRAAKNLEPLATAMFLFFERRRPIKPEKESEQAAIARIWAEDELSSQTTDAPPEKGFWARFREWIRKQQQRIIKPRANPFQWRHSYKRNARPVAADFPEATHAERELQLQHEINELLEEERDLKLLIENRRSQIQIERGLTEELKVTIKNTRQHLKKFIDKEESLNNLSKRTGQ